MRHNCFIFIFLLFILLLFSSCANAAKYYEQNNYLKAIEVLNSKKVLTKEEYLIKIKCLEKLDRLDEAKDSVLLYLLMDDNSESRAYVVDLYSNYEYSDILNVLLLKNSDGINSQIIRYISYTKLNEYDKAKEILFDYLAPNLTINQFATLLVAHPIDQEYVISFFKAWYSTVKDSEKNSFFSLLFYFLKTDLNDDILTRAYELLNKTESDDYIKNSTVKLALVYKYKGIICNKMNDFSKADYYWKKSYNLNPEDNETESFINEKRF